MTNEGRIPAIEDEHLVDSLRDNPFDLHSAIGELIDNSIQAEAKNIHVLIKDIPPEKKRVKFNLIDKIVCGDDGSGMDGGPGDVLQNSIRFGYSTRFNDRKGIGRFGVGMTYAGIKFATKIEVYSKKIGNKWYYITFDLTNHEDIHDGIAAPIQNDPPKEYTSLAGADQGTLVIWSKFDKYAEQDLHSNSHEDGFEAQYSLDPYGYLNHFIGRTYRKFIWKGVNFTVNGNPVYSFDPLYLNKTKNQFPDDEPAKKIWEDDIEWPIDPKLKGDEFSDKRSKVHYIISYLPKQYRKIRGRGGQDFKGRYIEENEGISILRSDREVFYDHLPYFQENRNRKLSWDDKDRWWSCEISYNPELDGSGFSISHIKRKIEPTKELKAALYQKIIEYRNRCINDEVPAYWKEVELVEAKKEEEQHPDLEPKHSLVEKIAQDIKIPEPKKNAPLITQEDESRRMAALTDHLDETIGAQWRAKFKNQPFTVMDARWPGPTFIQITYLDGQSVLQYNTDHLFFEELKDLRSKIQQLKDESVSTKYAQKMNELIDVLLMAFVQARKNWTHNEEFSVNDSIEHLVTDWGRYLKSYTEAYQKERLFEEDV